MLHLANGISFQYHHLEVMFSKPLVQITKNEKMKQILILIAILLSISCKSQTTYPLSNYDPRNLKNNNYIKDTEGILNQFVGTWQWIQGNNTFQIILSKEEHWNGGNNDDYFTDVIVGGYKYIENGNLVIDKLAYTTSFTSDISTWSDFTPILGGVTYPQTNQLNLSVYDKIKGKSARTKITLQAGTNGSTQAHWRLFDAETSNYHGSTKQQGFSIPTNIILTKIN